MINYDSKAKGDYTTIAKGAPPEAVAEAKKAKIETILRWLERAGKHAQAMEDALIRNFSVNRVELDGAM